MNGIVTASSSAKINLMSVHRQWASRPDDERFLTLEALHDDAKGAFDRATAEVLDINLEHYRVVSHGDEGLLVETASGLLVPTHHSFQQLAGEANAPAQFLRELHPEMAALNLNYCLHANGNRQAVQFLHESPREAVEGDPFRVLRAITSPGYGKTDEEVTTWLLEAGFGARQAADVIDFAKREEGDARTVWHLVNGATARARSTPYAQERTEREKSAGTLLDRLAA